jgi:hypothetical protein
MKNFISKFIIGAIILFVTGVMGNRVAHAAPSDPNYANKTFSAQIANITPAALATDVFTLTGSPSKIVRVTTIRVTGSATGASGIDFLVYKRTALDTAGTATNTIPVQSDSFYPIASTVTNSSFVVGNSYVINSFPVSTACNTIGAAANTAGTNFVATGTTASTCSATLASTAQVKVYSINPTALGYGLLLRADHYALLPAAAPAVAINPWLLNFGQGNEQAAVLRGVNESLAFNLNGQVIPAGTSLTALITWTEE